MRYLTLLMLLLLAACNMNQSPGEEPIGGGTQSVVYYWIGTDEPANEDAVLIGCQTYVSPIASSTPLGSPEDNIRNSLNLIFTTQPRIGERNVWADDLMIVADSVRIENNTAIVQLSGTMSLRGVCSDVEMEAQVLLAIFSEESVQNALIKVGDTNLRTFFDMSGQADEDFLYTRDNIPYAQP
jgi:hypothetical protein